MKPKPIIIPPISGWRPQSYYLVEASFSKGNPISPYIFYTGFLDKDGNPAGYNEFCRTEDRLALSDAVFCRAVKCVHYPNIDDTSFNIGSLPFSIATSTKPICP